MSRLNISGRSHRGFTLVELLIVVIILGILAGIVIPSYNNTSTEAAQTAFAHELRIYIDAAVLYEAKEGSVLEDGASGEVPDGFASYINTLDWVQSTPVGGVWDTDSFTDVESALGVHFLTDTPKSDAYMAKIDAIVDDGNLTTGGFQKFEAGRFYFIITRS